MHYKYANQPDDPDFNPKLYVKSGWNSPWRDCNLEDSLYNIRQDLLENFNKNKPRWRNNQSPEEQGGLREIKEDLQFAFPLYRMDKKKRLSSTLMTLNPILKSPWMTFRRHKVTETREKLVQSYSYFLPPNYHMFLRSLDDGPQSLNPTKLHIIPKIHKSPIAGRSVAALASHSFIDRPTSTFVDELVRPCISMPTLLRDSGEIIQCLGGIKLPTHCLFVTADVSLLYPNIETKQAIIALDLSVKEGKVAQTALLIQFTRLVLENNFLQSEFSRGV